MNSWIATVFKPCRTRQVIMCRVFSVYSCHLLRRSFITRVESLKFAVFWNFCRKQFIRGRSSMDTSFTVLAVTLKAYTYWSRVLLVWQYKLTYDTRYLAYVEEHDTLYLIKSAPCEFWDQICMYRNIMTYFLHYYVTNMIRIRFCPSRGLNQTVIIFWVDLSPFFHTYDHVLGQKKPNR